jgi:hypothetical protein
LRKTPAALVPITEGAITLRGTATAPGDPLRSPASDAACVHWRLRVYELVAPGVELVHEVIAPEPFELRVEGGRGPLRPVRVAAESAHIEAQPVFHREGSPGALAVARMFGLVGRVRVEEVVLRHGDALDAEGVLFDPDAASRGPYRTADAGAELFDVTVRVRSNALSLRPTLLAWAFGTSAALLGAIGAATVASKVWRIGLQVAAPTAEIGAAKLRKPRWP